ncbi:heparan-alpha-glucosaminide N-acetyltransferase [Devosia sp.]|uniref:DUF1624 domain-containing protein n=1 Tax=Devosia sp. TaxID=1871048 RepID=UPI003265D23B
MAQITSHRPRYAVVDIVRGIALMAMMIYHCFWDLAYFRFYPVDVSADLGWVIYARSILGTFLFLVGVGLVLGHGRAIRWNAFWKRFAMVTGAAIIVTIATLILFPQTFVYFGILHAIALFSLLALAFLRMPVWLVAVLALVILVVGWGYSNPFYNERIPSVLGLWTVPPPANDLVPLLPWFGLVLAGIAVARLVLNSSLGPRLAAFKATSWPLRGLAFLGRWSLLFYLIHQPILLGVIYPLSLAVHPGLAEQNVAFLNNCQSTCIAGGTSEKLCMRYCQCGLSGVIDNDLWNAVNSGAPNANEQMQLDVVTKACSALIYPVGPEPVLKPAP